jgi:hypothetical protein
MSIIASVPRCDVRRALKEIKKMEFHFTSASLVDARTHARAHDASINDDDDASMSRARVHSRAPFDDENDDNGERRKEFRDASHRIETDADDDARDGIR